MLHFVKKNPEEVPREVKLTLARRADAAARGAGPEVVQVIVSLGDSRQRVFIASSEGQAVDDERTRVRILVQVVAARGGDIQTGYEAPGCSAATSSSTASTRPNWEPWLPGRP